MIPFIHTPFVYAGDKLGAGPDELKLIFSILVSYPLAGLLKRVPDARPAYKNLFSLGCVATPSAKRQPVRMAS
jgi:lysophospholipid acyltransferase